MQERTKLDFPSQLWLPFVTDRAAVRCSPGHLIYLQGTEATCFYFLRSGRVKSFIQSEDGAERVLNLYEAGSLFGEASFFDELPRVSSAVALTSCELVAIDREQVVEQIAQDPAIAMAMLKYLARTVRLLSDQVDAMAFRPAKWRLARQLLTLPQRAGTVRCTQDELASAISVSRVTVSRLLSQMARDGLIHLGYGEIQLLDPTALSLLCQG